MPAVLAALRVAGQDVPVVTECLAAGDEALILAVMNALGRANVLDEYQRAFSNPPLTRYRVVIEFDADGPDRAQLAADHIAHGVGVAATIGCIDSAYTVDWHEV